MSRAAKMTRTMPSDRESLPAISAVNSVNKSYVYEINDCFNGIIFFSFTMNRNLFDIYVIKPQDD